MCHRINILSVIAVLALVTGCGEAPQPSPASAVAVTVTQASAGTVQRSLVAVGHVIAKDRDVVAAQVEARIIAVPVEVGQVVAPGTVLVEVEVPEVQARLDQALAEVERAEAQRAQSAAQVEEAEATLQETERSLTRLQRLRTSGHESEENLEQKRSAVQVATARLRSAQAQGQAAIAEVTRAHAASAQARLDLGRTRIVADHPAVVLRRLVDPGSRPAVGEPLLHLVRRENLEITAQVPVRAVADLTVGQTVTINREHRDVSGKVRVLEPEIDLLTRQVQLRISISETADWRVGEPVLVRLLVGQEHGLRLPITALRRTQPAQIVVVANGSAQVREVVLGLSDESQVIVRTGLEVGESVVAVAPALVENGQAVTAVISPAPGSKP